MARLLTYLLTPILAAAFWLVELLNNYFDYTSHDPMDLAQDYQKAFVFNYGQLLVSELFLPLILAIGFIILVLFKVTGRSIRLALGFLIMLSTEFWAYRAFYFSERMLTYHIRTETKDPTIVLPDDYKLYLYAFLAAFLLIIFLKEHSDEGPRSNNLDKQFLANLRNPEEL